MSENIVGKRLDYIDVSKGFGIILVIVGHISYTPELMGVWLSAFHMPLFFFFAGVTYNAEKYESFKYLLVQKVKALLIPYLFFSLIMVLWLTTRDFASAIYHNTIQIARGGIIISFFKNLLAIVIQIRRTRWGIGIWFLPCIFLNFLMLNLILRVSSKKIIALIISLMCFTVGYLYSKFLHAYPLSWGLDAAFCSILFMTLGFLLKENLVKMLETFGKFILPISFILLCLFAWLNYKCTGSGCGMWSSMYGNYFFYIFGALFGIAFILSLSFIKKSGWLSVIGRRSIYYYGLHVILIQILSAVIGKFFGNYLQNIYFQILATIIVTLLIIVLLWPFYNIYNKLVVWLQSKITNFTERKTCEQR